MAGMAQDLGAASAHIVLEEAVYGGPAGASPASPPPPPAPPSAFSSGLDGELASRLAPDVLSVTSLGPGGDWAAEAGALAGAVASGPSPAAVLFLGSGAGLAGFALHAGAYPELESARWIASSPVAGSPELEASPAGSRLAARTGLAAASWSIPENNITRMIDARLRSDPAGPAAPTARSYAAYDAVSVLGRAAAAAGGTAAGEIAAGLPDAAAAYGGALGDIILDPAGDLWQPNAYDVWTMRDGAGINGGPGWDVRRAAERGIDLCSIRLGAPALDMRVAPGGYSTTARQTVINSGSQEFRGVALEATPWYVDPDGRPEPGHPSLPASLAELSQEGPRSAYAKLGESGTTVAAGLGPGGAAPVWFRLNLTGHDSIPGSNLVQYVTYVADCLPAG